MDVKKYLERIHFTDAPFINEETLSKIHEQHVLHVPFGCASIHFKRKLSLEPDELFKKIITHRHDGFCYELNYLFHLLLTELGFKSTMIASRIFTTEGIFGPEFDHLSLVVDLDERWLVDVGYGDLFITPLKLIESDIQFDGRNYFKIEKNEQSAYVLEMSANGTDFEKRYAFTLLPRTIADFEASCVDKQVNPSSYFVQNTLITLPTKNGRRTIFNNKFIEKENGLREEMIIENDEQLKAILKSKFGIIV
ncbi:MAG TPA: arylamine N-acetyltransferase [Cyclobacteriaceae bacterium]